MQSERIKTQQCRGNHGFPADPPFKPLPLFPRFRCSGAWLYTGQRLCKAASGYTGPFLVFQPHSALQVAELRGTAGRDFGPVPCPVLCLFRLRVSLLHGSSQRAYGPRWFLRRVTPPRGFRSSDGATGPGHGAVGYWGLLCSMAGMVYVSGIIRCAPLPGAISSEKFLMDIRNPGDSAPEVFG